MSDNTEVFEHESYGLIGFSRCTGSKRLFGSAIPKHGTFISLRISHAQRLHHLSRDWYHPRKTIIELDLSAAQFADLITSMNMGVGVPCTINYLNGKIEPSPDLETEAEKVRTDFRSDIKGLVTKLKESQKEVKEILSQKTILLSDREKIRWVLDKVVQDVEANMPFVLDSFQEASDKVITHAKAEIEAFTNTRIMTAGIAALSNEDPTPKLEELNDEADSE